MAARTPRRSFATPFVVTLAVAPACYVQSTPPQEPVRKESTNVNPTTSNVINPPRPGAATTPNGKWRVYADATQNACFSQPVVTCPPNVACNPPRPVPYTCPDQNSYKLTPGMENAITVMANAEGTHCEIDWGPQDCPRGASCNPPPPVAMTCPRP
jgi:hypothetical protein